MSLFWILVCCAVITSFLVNFFGPRGSKSKYLEPVFGSLIILIISLTFWKCGWKLGLLMVPIFAVSAVILKPLSTALWVIIGNKAESETGFKVLMFKRIGAFKRFVNEGLTVEQAKEKVDQIYPGSNEYFEFEKRQKS